MTDPPCGREAQTCGSSAGPWPLALVSWSMPNCGWERALEGCTLPLLLPEVAQAAQPGLEMLINFCWTR